MSNKLNWDSFEQEMVQKNQGIEKAWGNDIEKAQGHKYFRREGTPGKYKYYYTEAEYKEAKGGKSEDTDKKTTTLKFKNTAKGQKAKAIAESLGDISEIAIIEELRLRGYSNHFTSEIYA